jgi:hypothetical protein
MKRTIPLLLFCLILAGCPAPPTPAWVSASDRYLTRYKESFLAGEDRRADVQFRQAVEEIKKSGDLDILQRAYLTHYALKLAAGEPFDAAEYRRMADVHPVAANENFFAFLTGAPETAVDLLPRPYRRLVAASRGGREQDLLPAAKAIRDPLSRLIAVGWLAARGAETEELLVLAADTSSRQGWRKVLVANLLRLQAMYLAQGQKDKAEAVSERLRLIRS